MKTQIKYIASSGNVYDLTTKDIIHRVATYYDWVWKAEGAKRQYGMRVSSFSREAGQYEAELIFGKESAGPEAGRSRRCITTSRTICGG